MSDVMCKRDKVTTHETHGFAMLLDIGSNALYELHKTYWFVLTLSLGYKFNSVSIRKSLAVFWSNNEQPE